MNASRLCREELVSAKAVLHFVVVFFLGIYAYATLKDDAAISAEDLRKELKAIVREKIGSFAVPEVIQVILFPIYVYV